MLPSRRIDLDLATGFVLGRRRRFRRRDADRGAELELSVNEKEEGDHRVSRCARTVWLIRIRTFGRSVYVRGCAPGYDSNGFFGYDFEGRDVVVAYRLRRQFKVCGRLSRGFAPGVAIEGDRCATMNCCTTA
jgi:hypothetical protein